MILEPRPFRLLKNLGRSRQIATVLLMHGFGDILERLHLGPYVQWGKRLLFWRRMEEKAPRHSRAERIRLALESLGATYIKFGQVMSTRPDLLPAGRDQGAFQAAGIGAAVSVRRVHAGAPGRVRGER